MANIVSLYSDGNYKQKFVTTRILVHSSLLTTWNFQGSMLKLRERKDFEENIFVGFKAWDGCLVNLLVPPLHH